MNKMDEKEFFKSGEILAQDIVKLFVDRIAQLNLVDKDKFDLSIFSLAMINSIMICFNSHNIDGLSPNDSIIYVKDRLFKILDIALSRHKKNNIEKVH